MTDSLVRIGPTQPGTSNGVLYTVPDGSQFSILSIHIVNTTASSATFNLAFGTAATEANCWAFEAPLDAYAQFDWSGLLAMDSLDTLDALQGTSSALTYTISGVLTTP